MTFKRNRCTKNNSNPLYSYNNRELGLSDFNPRKIIFIIFLFFSFVILFSYEEDKPKADLETSQSPSTSQVENKKFPELKSPKTVSFEWNYNQKEYKIDKILYKSAYDHYKNQPKAYEYHGDEPPEGWGKDYYRNFIKINEGDFSFFNLLSLIEGRASKNDLTKDETVELIISFVQSIPYDEILADRILKGDLGVYSKYPYEVLYENSGTCGGKSFLAYILLKKLGYGVALFEYEEDQHIALGIQCPLDDSTYNSGYCYAETTTLGHPIGIVPEYDRENNSAIKIEKINYFEEVDTNSFSKLERGKLFLETKGKIYKKVEDNLNKYNKIKDLRGKLKEDVVDVTVMKSNIDSKERELENLEEKLDYYESVGLTNSYNGLVPRYNQLLKLTKNLISEYNYRIDLYNDNVNKFNNLLSDLYQLS